MRHIYESVLPSCEPGDARCTGVPCPAALPRYFENTASESVTPYAALEMCKMSTCGNTHRVTEYAPKALGARSLRKPAQRVGCYATCWYLAWSSWLR
eukprot:3028775-Rhodomonas_salina.1